MPKNTLFNFITNQKETIHLPGVNDMVLSKTSNNKAYCRIELAIAEKIGFKLQERDLLLTQHHVSVYEYENNENPNLSHYHYTAYFYSDEIRFRLHVYFDDNNQLTKNPTLEKMAADTSECLMNIGDIEKQLTALAIRYTFPVIEILKKQQNNCINHLDQQYEKSLDELNKALFDKNIGIPGLRLLVNETLQWSISLMQLVKRSHLSKENRFLHAMQKSMRDAAEPSLKIMHSPAALPILNEEEATKSEDVVALSDSHKKAIQPQEMNSDSSVARHFETIKIKLVELDNEKNSPPQDLIKKIEELLLLISDFYLLYEEQLDLASLKQLQDFRLNVFGSGDVLFKRLVMGQQFNLAEQMPSFFHRITPNYLALALHQKNEALLEFVLRHADFDVSQQEITVGGRTYCSAVHACILLNTGSSMKGCFEKLLLTGQSMLAVDRQGKPLILPLLVGKHPLEEVLREHRNKTIDSLNFLKPLRILLENYLANGQPDSTEKVLVLKSISKCSRGIDILGHCKVLPGLNLARKYANSLANMDKHAIIERLQQEPEFKNLIAELNHKLSQMIQTARKHKAQSSMEQAPAWGDLLKDMIDKADLSTQSYEELKEKMLSLLKNSLAILNKRIELLTLSKDAMVVSSKREGNRIIANVQRLESEVKSLSKANPFMQFSQNSNSQQTRHYQQTRQKKEGDTGSLPGLKKALDPKAKPAEQPLKKETDGATREDSKPFAFL